MRMRRAFTWASFCFAGGILVAAGWSLSGRDLAALAPIVGQAGTPNPPLLRKLQLVPTLLAVTGVQCLMFAAIGIFLSRRDSRAGPNMRGNYPLGLRLLVAAWAAVAVLSVNFGAISLANRLKQSQSLSAAERTAADLGDDYQIVRDVRASTPETAVILIRTGRPLQFLLNYDLYPRKFYFYSDRDLPIASIPESWMNRRHIDWTLEISDGEPLQFKLRPRKASF